MSVRAALAIAGLAAFLVPAAALGADGGEQQLAEKYAPVVGLKQHEPCAETGEPYRPVPVETVLGRSDVVLLGPDGEVAKEAPTAADLYGKDEGYWLDFPGDPLDAGCSYEQWFDRIAAGKATTAYAHIVEEEREARTPVLALLPLQRLEQQARVGLGDDPARLRRSDCGGGARQDA